MDSLCVSSDNGDNLLGDPSTKKVRFKDKDNISDVEMIVESSSAPTPSWKDMESHFKIGLKSFKGK